MTLFQTKIRYINIHNKLFQIQPTLGEWRPTFRKSREQVVISRLHIVHTRLTHSFILKQEPQPQCLTCQTTCTGEHILIECEAFAVIRKRFFKVTSLIELFENIKRDGAMSFLRETGLYEKIWRIKSGYPCANKWNPAYRKFYLLSIRAEIFGWMYIHRDRIWR